MSTIDVFIENEAGSDVKHHYDEERLELLRVERVKAPYPFPYGFVPGTLAPDGDAADCFVITGRPLGTGDRVECEPVALMESTEGGLIDHNLIAVEPGDPVPDLEAVAARIGAFVLAFTEGMPGRETTVGQLLPVEDAEGYLVECAEAFEASS